MDEIMEDYYAHQYFEDPKLADEVEDEDFNADSVAAQLGYGGDAVPQDPNDWEDLK